MKTVWLLILALSASWVPLAAVPFAERIDASAEVVLSVQHLAQIPKLWAEHPITAQFEQLEWPVIFEPLWDAADGAQRTAEAPRGFGEVLQDEFGLSADDLLALFPGQASLVGYNLSAFILQPATRVDLQLMVECRATPAQLDELMQIQFKRNAAAHQKSQPGIEHELRHERFMGVDLYFDEVFDGQRTYVEDGYALVEGIFVLATTPSRLRAAVESILEGPPAPLAASAAYQRADEASGRDDVDVAVYVNLQQLLAPFNDALLRLPMLNTLGMFGVSAQSLQRALSLQSLQAWFLAVDVMDTGLLLHSGLIYTDKRGLLSLLSYLPGTLPEARYVPEQVLSSSISQFDLAAMLANLEGLLAQASPSLPPLLDLQMQILKTSSGVDLRAALIDNIGAPVVSWTLRDRVDDEWLTEQLLVLEVKDAQALSHAIETFKGRLASAEALLKVQRDGDHTLYTLQLPESRQPSPLPHATLSFVVTRTNLILCVGRVGLLHEVLARMTQGGAGFWQQPHSERWFESIAQPNPVARWYVDLEPSLTEWLRSWLLATASRPRAAQEAAERAAQIELPYQLFAELNEAPDGLFSRILIINREASE